MLKKILKVFTKSQCKDLIVLSILTIISSFMELMGVSIILPFINILIEPRQFMNNKYIHLFASYLNIQDVNQMIVIIAIGIIIIYVLKNLIYISMINQQYRFTYYGKRELSNRIMRFYLYKKYSFHLENNSADLIRDINNDVDMFYATVLAILQMVSELGISVTLIVFLFIMDATVSLGIAVGLGGLCVLFLKSYRKILLELGNERRVASSEMTKCLMQSFNGIKEIKVANNEDFFLNAFKQSSQRSADAMCQNLILNAIPKPIIEIVCIFSLMIIVCVKVLTGNLEAEFVATLSVFTFGALRLLPSVNKLTTYIGNIMHNCVTVDSVYEHMKGMHDVGLENVKKSAGRIEIKNQIAVDHLSFSYGCNEYVLKDINLIIAKNQSVAFVGESGSGKSTLVDLILGILEPQQGSIVVDGRNIADFLYEWHECIGYIPQTIYLLDDTIRNNVAFGQESIDDSKVWAALAEAQLEEFVTELPEQLNTRVGEFGVRLSGGQRQRLGIARALYNKPQVLILDEATSALDEKTEKAVMKSIEGMYGKVTLIVIAHRLSTIEKCETVYEVKDGYIIKRR